MHEHDPWIYVGHHQQTLERVTKTLLDIVLKLRRLKEAGVLDASEYVAIRHLMMDKLHILERIADQEVERMLLEGQKQKGPEKDTPSPL